MIERYRYDKTKTVQNLQLITDDSWLEYDAHNRNKYLHSVIFTDSFTEFDLFPFGKLYRIKFYTSD